MNSVGHKLSVPCGLQKPSPTRFHTGRGFFFVNTKRATHARFCRVSTAITRCLSKKLDGSWAGQSCVAGRRDGPIYGALDRACVVTGPRSVVLPRQFDSGHRLFLQARPVFSGGQLCLLTRVGRAGAIPAFKLVKAAGQHRQPCALFLRPEWAVRGNPSLQHSQSLTPISSQDAVAFADSFRWNGCKPKGCSRKLSRTLDSQFPTSAEVASGAGSIPAIGSK